MYPTPNKSDKIFTKSRNHYKEIERISNVDKAILYTGITELKLNSSLSKNIIISEYIEIAQQMCGENNFINKVLDKFSENYL